MVEVKGLSRYYGDFAALKDVSFTIQEGEIVGQQWDLLGLTLAAQNPHLVGIMAGPSCKGTSTAAFAGERSTQKGPPQLLA